MTSDTPRRRAPRKGAQRPGYSHLRHPFQPQSAFSEDEIAAMHDTALRVLEDLGIRILLDEARAVAALIDARRGQVLLVSKKREPPELFALQLRPNGKGVQTARPLGRLAGVPQPTADDLRQRCEAASALLGWPAPYAEVSVPPAAHAPALPAADDPVPLAACNRSMEVAS